MKFWQKCFSNLAFFPIVSRLCSEVYWLSDRILSAGSSKLSFTSPGEHFEGSLILWKNVIVSFVLRFWAKISPMLSKLYSLCPEVFSEEFFQKCYGFYFFGLWAKFLGFHLTFFYTIFKTAFYVFRGPSWDKGFFNYKTLFFFHHCWTLSKTCLCLLRKILTALS